LKLKGADLGWRKKCGVHSVSYTPAPHLKELEFENKLLAVRVSGIMKKAEIRFPSSLKGSRHLAKVDSKLAALIKEVGSVTVKLDPSESVYESLGISIIYQHHNGGTFRVEMHCT
jgi:hypothetical protein